MYIRASSCILKMFIQVVLMATSKTSLRRTLDMRTYRIRLLRFCLWTSVAIAWSKVAGELPPKANEMTSMERGAKAKVATVLSQIGPSQEPREIESDAVPAGVNLRNPVDRSTCLPPRKRKMIKETTRQPSIPESGPLAADPVPNSPSIRTTTLSDDEASPTQRAFDTEDRTQNLSENSLFGFDGGRHFKPSSIFEVPGEEGGRFRFMMDPASEELDRAISQAHESVRSKLVSIRSFSPSLAYIAVQHSHEAVRRFSSWWKALPNVFSSYQLQETEHEEVYRELFLPFFYYLILQKPTPLQWWNIEAIFLKFMIYWKVQLLYNTRILTNIDYDRVQSQLLEHVGKAFMWISDLLCRMCNTEFLDNIREKHYKRHGPISRIFQCIQYDERFNSKLSNSQGHEMYNELLKRWQTDCNAGYPFHVNRNTHTGFEFRKPKCPENGEDSKDAGMWWFSTSLEIVRQSEEFLEIQKRAALLHPELTELVCKKKKYSLSSNEMEPADMKIYNLFENPSKSKKGYLQMMKGILELIPHLPLHDSIPKEKNLYMFNNFINYEDRKSESLYLPDLVNTFFRLEDMVPPGSSFWIELNEHSTCHD